jgi:CheY-like chemotaxis protein
MKILYVEDTLLNLCLIERIARIGNHEVINYAFAERALRNFERDKPDLVLVDIRLEGEMSGVELIQRLRSAGHKQPIAVITAIISEDMRERCMLVGADAYFTKPVPVRDLMHLIQRYSTPAEEQEEKDTLPAPLQKEPEPQTLDEKAEEKTAEKPEEAPEQTSGKSEEKAAQETPEQSEETTAQATNDDNGSSQSQVAATGD